MDRGAVGLVKAVVVGLGLTAGVAYAMNMGTLPSLAGVASGLSMMLAVVPVRRALPSIVVAVLIFFLGVMMVGSVTGAAGHHAQIVRDVGWTQAALAAWLVYLAASEAVIQRRPFAAFDDAARARWRQGDLAFATELARSIPAGAQSHWVALVIETGWPEPRPALAAEVLDMASAGDASAIAAVRARLEGKGGGASEARWDLLRAGCDAIAEGRAARREDCGGPAASRLVLAAAKVARDDDEATRIFAALTLPVLAGALERRRGAE